MEQEAVTSIISCIDRLKDYTPENSDIFTRELCLAFMAQISLIRILFSGREQSHLGVRLDRALKEVIFRKYPEYKEDPAKQADLSVRICAFYHLVFFLFVVYTGQTISGSFSLPHAVPEAVPGTNNHIRRFPSKIPFV